MAEMENGAGIVKTVDRDRIDMKRFGGFVASRRGEQGLTQKQLAERLFVSNKAVSKWECGLSMPDIALLEPLAEALGVTVEELLHGRREEKSGLAGEEIRQMTQDFNGISSRNGRPSLETVKKRAVLYAIEWLLAGGEAVLLWLFGSRFGIGAEDAALDLGLGMCLPLFFGIWFFFLMREKLPAYYDKERICFYNEGFFQLSLGGMRFSNRNWPCIMKAGRVYCFLVPVLWPLVYFLLRLVLPAPVWVFLRLPVLLLVLLGGLFIPMLWAGKKYE